MTTPTCLYVAGVRLLHGGAGPQRTEIVWRLRRGVGRLPVSVVLADVNTAKVGQAEDDAVADFGTLSRCFA